MEIRGIYLVTEEYGGRSHYDFAVSALKAGVRIIQYREKRKSSREMLDESLCIKKAVEDSGGIFIVNDRLDIALAAEAHGLHIGKDDLPLKKVREIAGERLLVGVSVSSVDEALRAEEDGADYVAVSPVFDTTTKEDAGYGLGLEMVRRIKAAVRIPVVAIGGINRENITDVVKAGCDACAVVSAITRARDPYKAAEELVELFLAAEKRR
jgi:thiamine-phosphate pyrophosphorylase